MSGGPLEEVWNKFRDRVIPANAPEQQVFDMRFAFYSGAGAAIDIHNAYGRLAKIGEVQRAVAGVVALAEDIQSDFVGVSMRTDYVAGSAESAARPVAVQRQREQFLGALDFLDRATARKDADSAMRALIGVLCLAHTLDNAAFSTDEWRGLNARIMAQESVTDLLQ